MKQHDNNNQRNDERLKQRQTTINQYNKTDKPIDIIEEEIKTNVAARNNKQQKPTETTQERET